MVYAFTRRCVFFYLGIVTCNTYTDTEQAPCTIAYSLCERAKEYIVGERYTDAAPLLQEALTHDPSNLRAQLYLAHTYFNDHQYDDALTVYLNLLKLVPENPEIYCNIGMCSYMLQKNTDAITYFEKALEVDPQCTTAHLHIIGSLEKERKYTEAFEACKRFLSINPLHREGLLSAGLIAKKLGHIEDALWYYRTLHNHYPEDFQAMVELAAALTILEEYEEALELYTKALTVKPESLSTFYNLGFTLKKLGHIDEAITIYKQVLKQKPDHTLAHFSLGLSYLAKGDFEKGWPEYEWRWKAYQESPGLKQIPAWDGSALNGKKIYVYGEQGYGDTFQFVRYLKTLKEQGAYIIFAPQQPLIPFMKLVPYIDEVVSSHEQATVCDYQVALMSLPLLCHTTVATIPTEIPYLQPEPALVNTWSTTFDGDSPDTYRVGICWHGNSQYKDPSLRRAVEQKSCPLTLFVSLAEVPNVKLYSLQKISGLDELSTLEDPACIALFPNTFDTTHGRFMDTAALITHLDLVITVDTAIAHLAGALGVETWNLLPEPADWRWMLERADTPWYPTMRLFRQKTRGDWESLMHSVQQALQEKAAAKKQGKIRDQKI